MGVPRDGWGPEVRRAAVSVTFDNLGEAAELELGTWPSDKAIGEHPSCTRVVPKVLAMLDEYKLRATFFVEGWNTGVYPDVLRSIAEAGHDVGYHGWRHEDWGKLEREDEAALLDRGIEAMGKLGIELKGLRPPGGLLTPSSLELLAERGFTFCSPAAKAVTLSGGVAVLPFEWRSVDGYYYLEQLAALRESYGDPANVLEPRYLEQSVNELLATLVRAGGCLALIFHPFLAEDDGRFDVVRRIVDRVTGDDSIWCAPCSEVAEWVSGKRERFEGDPVLDDATWR